ncbi:PilN domain-containing protein [Geoalkalibacter sp.]|uniref:PilN domain-containing protein n=1 Tax=Geoalkalibacter sp. TaxID=3041440 RepID=UPI00272DCBDF|nr:PilN domain-containing protein [Geoalkalibacter sp.]
MKISLNLANRTYVNRRAWNLGYAVAGLGLSALLVLHGVFLWQGRGQLGALEKTLEGLRQEAAARGEGAVEVSPAVYQQMLEDIAKANSILERDSFRWTQLLDRFEEVIPEGVSLRSILPDYKTRALNLTAVARGLEEMTTCLDQLMKSEHFRQTYLLRQEKTTVVDFAGREREAVLFSLVVREAF